jgi:hypothetical protein
MIVLSILAACEVSPPPVASSTAAVTGTTQATGDAPWVVQLNFSAHSCTGSVLTEHYMLTAAHCVTDEPNPATLVQVFSGSTVSGASIVYSGPARFYVNEQFHAHDITDDTENDIALIFLSSGPGVDLTRTGQAKLWNNFDQPWTSSNAADRTFDVIGWGLGDLAGGSDCQDGTSGVKRLGTGFVLDQTSPYPIVATAPEHDTHWCEGDSGAPLLYVRGGEYIQFGIATDTVSIPFDNYQEGPYLPPKLGWLYDETNLTGITLQCSGGGYAGGVGYLQCVEYRPPPPPPPPPGTACPSRTHCCEANPDGPSCLLCYPNTRECP